MRFPSSIRFLVAALCAMASLPALAEEGCHTGAELASQSTLNVRIDNDMFGGIGQDQGYTNGFLVSSVSPNLANFTDDPCLPAVVRALNRHLQWIQPEGFDEQNMTMGFGQAMYTPADRTRTDLIKNDRPYAGALLFSLGYNARLGNDLRTSQIRVGVVGPASLASQVQSAWHGIIGVDKFRGWDNQLRNEAVFQYIHERRRRLWRTAPGSAWGSDLVGHLGGSLGNFATYANTGFEWRFGYHLPDDFGTAPLRPAGENTSPAPPPTHAPDWGAHLFVATDARWVLHDITLDGNTFASSHSVDKRALVADLGYGVAISRGSWRFAFTRYHRTQEFRGQKDVPVYGSITISKRF